METHKEICVQFDEEIKRGLGTVAWVASCTSILSEQGVMESDTYDY